MKLNSQEMRNHAFLMALHRAGIQLERDLKPQDQPDALQLQQAENDNEILVYGTIVDEDTRAWLAWWDISAVSGPSFRKQLAKMSGDVTVRIDSPGGDISQASMIQGAITEYTNAGNGSVNGIVEGLAFSAASIITLSMNYISMYSLAEMMIHGPNYCMCGDLRDFEFAVIRLESMEKEIVSMYAKQMGKSEADTQKMIEDTTFFTASQAVENNLADEIIETSNSGNDDGDDDSSTNKGKTGLKNDITQDPPSRVRKLARMLH